MNINSFLNETEYNAKNVICLDFDGVIHDDYLGFHDGTIYGNPIEGSIFAITELSKKYKIIIYTCKANPDRPIINNKTGIELIWDWLEKHNIKGNIFDITYKKPIALIYIDDKAVRFENWTDTFKLLNTL